MGSDEVANHRTGAGCPLMGGQRTRLFMIRSGILRYSHTRIIDILKELPNHLAQVFGSLFVPSKIASLLAAIFIIFS